MSVRSRRVGEGNDHVGGALQLCYVSTPQRSLPWSAGCSWFSPSLRVRREPSYENGLPNLVLLCVTFEAKISRLL